MILIQKDSYTRFVPPACVKRDLTNTPHTLLKIWERQVAAKSIFNKCNKLELLQMIYNKYPTDKYHALIEKLNLICDDGISKLMRDVNISEDDKHVKKTELIEARDKNMRKIFKKSIETYKSEYSKMTNLTEEEQEVITFINLNPNFMILFDDCQAEIKEWGKDDNIRKIFFQGRHNFLTTMFAFQTNNGLHVDFRQNAFVNIFTSSNAAIGYFSNKANNLSTQLKKKMINIIDEIYVETTDPKLPKNYKKLVYMPQDSKPIRYVLAKIQNNLKFGDENLWKLSKIVEEKKEEHEKQIIVKNGGGKMFKI